MITGASVSLGPLVFARADAVGETPAVARELEFHNTHTGETVAVIYRRGESWDTAAMAQLRHNLRDHRSGEAHDIDPALYDQLYDLAIAAGRAPRFEIISGYRSPVTNAKMAAAGRGVAKRSLHMEGRALDVRLHRCKSAGLRDLALAAGRGGVGYYARSDFVHLDTGRFRSWAG